MSDDLPRISVPRAAIQTVANFRVTYHGVRMQVRGTNSWIARRQTIISDGAGSFQRAPGYGSHDGLLILPGKLGTARDVAVAADGTITAGSSTGMVSSDGRVAVLVQGPSTNTPTFEFFMK